MFDREDINFAASLLGIGTAVIGIANFLFSIFYGWSIEQIAIPAPPSASITIKIISFLLLEGCLAYAFGLFIVAMAKNRGMPQLIIIIIAIISAWTSLFNVQWIFTGPLPDLDGRSVDYFKDLGKHVAFIIAGGVAAMVAIYFIAVHYDEKNLSEALDEIYADWLVRVQGWAFVLMAIIFKFA